MYVQSKLSEKKHVHVNPQNPIRYIFSIQSIDWTLKFIFIFIFFFSIDINLFVFSINILKGFCVVVFLCEWEWDWVSECGVVNVPLANLNNLFCHVNVNICRLIKTDKFSIKKGNISIWSFEPMFRNSLEMNMETGLKTERRKFTGMYLLGLNIIVFIFFIRLTLIHWCVLCVCVLERERFSSVYLYSNLLLVNMFHHIHRSLCILTAFCLCHFKLFKSFASPADFRYIYIT